MDETIVALAARLAGLEETDTALLEAEKEGAE